MKRYTRFIIASMLIGIFLSIIGTVSQAQIDPKDVRAYWLFDEGDGKVAKDHSGNGNDATLQGNAKWTKEGKFNDGLLLDGASGMARVEDDPSLDIIDAITVMIWCRIDKSGSPGTYVLLVKKNGAYSMQTWNNFLGFEKVGPPEHVHAESKHNLTGDLKDEWHHFAGTYDKKSLKFYIDGELDAELPYKLPLNVTGEWIRVGGGEAFFKGAIDEIAILSVAVTEKQVKSAIKWGLENFILGKAVEPISKLPITWGKIKSY